MSVVRWKSARPFYVRLWYGDYELSVAFFAIGLAGFLGLVQWNWEPSTAPITKGNDLDWLSAVGLISHSTRQPFTILLLVVIVNCVWRSAYRFEGKAVWRRMARSFIVAGAIAVSFFANPTWFEKANLYLTAPPVAMSRSDIAEESKVMDGGSAPVARRRVHNEPASTIGPWVSFSQ